MGPQLLNPRLWNQCAAALLQEQRRISQALRVLTAVCDALEDAECPAIVIKSLDHWPDIGSDLDLYTSGPEEQVVSAMRKTFAAEILPRSWGDRLAHKWNFKLPGLPEAIEVHVGCLGQTGEHLDVSGRPVSIWIWRIALHAAQFPGRLQVIPSACRLRRSACSLQLCNACTVIFIAGCAISWTRPS